MDYLIVAFIAASLGVAVGGVLADRRRDRLLLRPPTDPDPELRLVDIGEEKRDLYRQIDALDAEEGFIIETWNMGSRPVPQYHEYVVEWRPTD
jgi:hypothetical protein